MFEMGTLHRIIFFKMEMYSVCSSWPRNETLVTLVASVSKPKDFDKNSHLTDVVLGDGYDRELQSTMKSWAREHGTCLGSNPRTDTCQPCDRGVMMSSLCI